MLSNYDVYTSLQIILLRSPLRYCYRSISSLQSFLRNSVFEYRTLMLGPQPQHLVMSLLIPKCLCLPYREGMHRTATFLLFNL